MPSSRSETFPFPEPTEEQKEEVAGSELDRQREEVLEFPDPTDGAHFTQRIPT